MLRDELLRSKKDEIARCLSSRKRKLSELYFATVGFAGATENAPADSLYHQKEQAFLDANDLSKGRYFNEATLPPLPDYASILARRAKEQKRSEAKVNDATIVIPPLGAQSAAAQATADVDGRQSKPQQALEQKPSGPKPEHSAPKASNQVAPAIVSQVPQGPNVLIPGVAHPSQSFVAEKKVPLSKSYNHQPFNIGNALEASVSAALAHPTPAASVASPSTPGSSAPTSASALATAPKHHDARSFIPQSRAAYVPEQPLSPVSSVGPCSNHTPVPVTVSPVTSPAGEMIDASDKVPTPKDDETIKAPPSLVPSTPDEQLRLEEAQSLQQNALVAAKTNGDGVEGGATTGEVIQENVTSTPATAKETSKEETELEPILTPLEPKRHDGVAETADDPHPVIQQPVLAPQTEADAKVPIEAAPALKKPTPPTIQAPPPPERMTTRVSSGAIRHKSVSEILGEVPKTPVSQSDKGFVTEKPAETARDVSAATPDSAARMRFKDRKAREKERTKLSTVVFPKQQQQQHQTQDKNESMELVRQHAGDLAKLNEEQDYLFTLFQNRAYAPPRGTSLSTLIASAHKTLTTSNHFLDYQEQMDCRTLRRIYSLQNANRWPLRQLKRSVEPPREGTHWDVLLNHMKWMRTDFREERKWKIAAAKSCADWCAEYVNSDREHRSLLRVQVKAPALRAENEAEAKSSMISPLQETGDEMLAVSHPTPDLVPSTEEDSVSEGFNDEPRHDLHDTVAPAAIFSLGIDEFTFSLDMTPAAQKLLDELPTYIPVTITPDTDLPAFKEPPDSEWKTEILPVSKYASGKITFHDDEPPPKRSRYDYSQYQSDPEQAVLDLPPEQTNVALFRPENRHIRDRIHPGHSFRPPTEHPMPSVGFFESRQSSQWTYAEDDELRRLVKDYSYNWSLISNCLTPSSQFTSGAERRTPWECFERWVGLEGLPADMSKTQYFRAYHQRLETAQRTVLAQQQAAQQQQQQQQQQQSNNNSNPQSLPPVRRRTTQPLRVDRKRSSKHLALLDAMRKLAKKRETMLQKQQHASHLASLRKVNEANQPKPPISSPAEFSRLKYERELKLQERQEQYRQQMIAQQRANLVVQRTGQIPNQQPIMNAPGRTPGAMPHNPGTSAMTGNTTNGLPNGVPPAVGANQARPHMQGMPNGTPVNPPTPQNTMAMKMMPQSGMQQNNGARPGMPMQTPPDNTRVIREANRLQEQQRILQTRQQQPHQQPLGQSQHPQQQFHNQPQFVPQGSHSPNPNIPNVNGTPNNPAMMAALQAGGGMQSPSFHNATPQGVSTPSPRMGQPNLLSGGVVPTISSIQNQIQRNNPTMPPEQVSKLATDRLHQYQQQRMSQVAMSAAAGNIGSVQANYQVDASFQSPQPSLNGGAGMQVPQAQGYSPMMRVPQPAQQNRVGVGGSPAMNGAISQPSRSVTPQTQRSGSAQAGAVAGTSKSPNPPQAQPVTN
ncbi:MYB and HSA domain protein [Aspergillus ibericus CBS 121593]|uniref:Vacuolar import and degradation protein 21 n=1 Tax=Aspergillus ibericus CBS 121593 TaxID=1448316 RepID=A0A395HEB1_9EURO|nr:MYB and HSA domain protein [Aspergillus ibericus CBS 121593]RAL05849.1 MYB and HSA domain protein [Aspergillus ibericus CBS 121593]